ncbi:hypothetical protein Tco_0572650 [Tanacetum coccineum]
MTRNTVKRLTKPLDEPEREFQRLRRAAWRLQKNESLAIVRRNLFDDEASSSNNTGTKPPTPPKILHEHSHPNSSDALQPTFRGHLKRACKQISYLETPTRTVGLKDPYLICNYCGGPHEAKECKQDNPAEQVCLSEGDIYDDPSLLRFYQNDDVTPWGNSKQKEGDDGPEWVVRSKFEDELANFMLEKIFHTKGIREMLDQHHKEMRRQIMGNQNLTKNAKRDLGNNKKT